MSLARRLNNKGMSLVEVLIALGVFAIGILAVARMFPGGFLVVKQGEDATLAARLAQTELERWRNMAANLPAGILPWGLDGSGNGIVIPDTDPLNLRDYIGSVDEYRYKDVNKFRRIHAEATKIPVPLDDSPIGVGSIYVLGFGPIEWNDPTTSPDPAPMAVYGGPMIRKDSPLGVRSTWDYAIDYENNQIYLKAASFDRQFVISYSYWYQSGSGSPRLVSVVSKTISVSAGAGDAWINIQASGDPTIDIEEGSDSLSRAFIRLPWSDPWSADDPYQYKVVTPSNPIAGNAAGILAFNPLGYGATQLTTRGREPLTAYIDYCVMDWHIIREERKIPDGITSNSDPQMKTKLTLRFLKQRGETRELDGTDYQGLGPNLQVDVAAIDLSTGEVYTERDKNPAFTVNYKDGIITFLKATFASGRTFRFYYKADGDWALQPYKAFEVFTDSNGNDSPDFRQYYADWQWNGTDERWELTDQSIYLPRCYAGCTVAADYTYYDKGGVSHTVTGRAIRIPDSTSIGYLCQLNLGENLPSGAQIARISRVYGVSLGARVILRNSGRGFAAGKWKPFDLQTYLTRERL
jgi:prepilin-type N-terminal cleavage/methylation domain-containing protein